MARPKKGIEGVWLGVIIALVAAVLIGTIMLILNDKLVSSTGPRFLAQVTSLIDNFIK